MASLSVLSVTWLAGLALICIALVGGGIEIKEIKIPAISIIPRILSFACGCILFVLGFAANSGFIPSLQPAAPSHSSADASLAPAPASEPAVKPAPPPTSTMKAGPVFTTPAAIAPVPASEQAQPTATTHLTADDITSLIVDHKFHWTGPRGATGTILYKSDRHSILTLNQGPISSDSGNWWLNRDSICVAWDKNQSSDRCISFERIGNNRLRTDTGFIWSPF